MRHEAGGKRQEAVSIIKRQQFQLTLINRMYRGQYSLSMPKTAPKPYGSLKMPQKFPEDIECIIKSPCAKNGSLYISNIEAAENLSTLKKLKIEAILTCAKGYELHHPKDTIADYMYIPFIDHEGCDISGHLNGAVDFIKDTLAKTNLLVHCIAGVSRSVSMVIAFMIREQNRTYDEAYRVVKARRRIICPNSGFICQLRQYQQKQCQQRSSALSPATKTGVSPVNKTGLSPVNRTGLSPVNKTGLSPKASKDKQSPRWQKQSQVQTPSKHNNYLSSGLRQLKSTQLTPQTPKSQCDEKVLQRYQSTQISPSKAQPSSSSPNKYKYSNYLASASSYYTPDKADHSRNTRHELLKNYDHSKAPYAKTAAKTANPEKHKSASTQLINIEKSPSSPDPEAEKGRQGRQGKQGKQGTFNMKSSNDLLKAEQRDGSFKVMNKELNDKIEQIRKKYDNEREKLYQRYQLGNRKTEEKSKHEDHARYASVEPRGRTSLTAQRNYFKNAEDYLNARIIPSRDYSNQKLTLYKHEQRAEPSDHFNLYPKRAGFEDDRARRQDRDAREDRYGRGYPEERYSRGYPEERRQERGQQGYDIRRNADVSVGVYSQNRYDALRGQDYSNYLSKYPTYYGHRRF